MKFLFLSTHNLATNPRLYKELRLAVDFGYKVEVVCFDFENWSKPLNEELKLCLAGVRIISIPAGRKPFIPWFRSVVFEKFYRRIGKFVPLSLPLLGQAVSRRNALLIDHFKHVSKPDWVIGHNPGALYATMVAGKKFKCKTGFDVEDYHPGEGHDIYLQQLSGQLMKTVLPSMNYVSFASPLIKKATQESTGFGCSSWFTVMNVFPSTEFRESIEMIKGPVKLVWFSQNIDYGRGLELLLPSIKNRAGRLELHLFGNMNTSFFQHEIKGVSNIIVHAPLPQKELHQCLANFDIGLALEPAKDRNNALAVSNKMLAYLQAGLYVLASNTEAQQEIIQSYPEHGCCFDYKKNKSDETVEMLTSKIGSIRSNRQWRYQNFKNNNWEAVSKSLLSVWSQQ